MKMLAVLLIILPVNSALAVNLFNAMDYQALAADRSAARAGDVLTILVMETSNAESAADLSSGKQISSALSAAYNGQAADVSLGLSGKGKTAARTARNGKIKAALTVQIDHPIGPDRFAVSGEQRIFINGEQQFIHLSGIVRKADISAQNTVLSTRLAHASIRYSGLGSVSNSQRFNYLYKALSFLGLV